MTVRARTPELPPPAAPVPDRREIRGPRISDGDIKRDPEAPVVGVHWSVIAVALGAAIWFVIAAVVFYGSGDPASDYLLWIVGGFAAGFFGLTLGLARWAAEDPRYGRRVTARRFSDFVNSNVAIFTGAIHGREALTQLLTLPVVLAIGATMIGLAFRLVG